MGGCAVARALLLCPLRALTPAAGRGGAVPAGEGATRVGSPWWAILRARGGVVGLIAPFGSAGPAATPTP